MPSKRQILEVSSDESFVPEAPKERRAQKEKLPSLFERSSEQYLRSTLARECKCRRRTCLQQFIATPEFTNLADYRCHWFELHKLDQDQFVSRPCIRHFSMLCIFFVTHPANLCECLLTCDMILYSSDECFHGTRCKCSEFIGFCECKWIKVFDRIKDLQRECGDSNITWKLLGTRICRRAWRTLHCIGPRDIND